MKVLLDATAIPADLGGVGRYFDDLVPFPPKTHEDRNGQKPYTTVGDWIRNLPPLKAGESDAFDPDHQAARLSEKNLLRIRNTPEGGDRRYWPDELRLPCHRSMSEAAGQEGHTDVYGRLAFDKPASGLTTRCIRTTDRKSVV